MNNTTLKAITTLTLLSLLTACSGNNGKGKQNSNHGLINTPPKAKHETFTLDEDTQKTITLKATDEDNDTIGYRVSKQPKHGKLKGKAPKLTYIPDPDYNGKDSFSFIANDGSDDSNETEIELNINPVNDAPIAKDDKVSLDEDHNITIDVLANDSDVDEGDRLEIIKAYKPQHGTASIKNNSILYKPEADYNGKDTFNYKIKDKDGATAVASVYISINSVNDAPVAKDDKATTTINTPLTINVLNNDSDIDDHDILTVSDVSKSDDAEVSIKDNKIVFIPKKDYTGAQTLTYTIKDQHGASAKASIKITVRDYTDAEKYKQLEDSGAIPKLDRSDTLAGTDSDNNGIRDDVDDYINKKYTNPKEKAAAQQMARAYQKILLVDKNDIKKVTEVDKRVGDAVICAVDTAPNKGILSDIKAVTLNTKQRVKEFFKYDNLLDGTVSSLPQGDTCEK